MPNAQGFMWTSSEFKVDSPVIQISAGEFKRQKLIIILNYFFLIIDIIIFQTYSVHIFKDTVVLETYYIYQKRKKKLFFYMFFIFFIKVVWKD